VTSPRFSLAAYGLPVHELLDLARAAEKVGFDMLWLGEHLVVPASSTSTHPTAGPGPTEAPLHAPVLDAGTVLQDPWVALAAVATATRRLRLATGILVLPLQHPLVVARAAASLQQLSEGRFVLGVGAGWVREEFEALGLVFEQRGHRLDEELAILRDAWAGGPVAHHGGHFSFRGVQVTPSSVCVPVVVGGHSPPALRRAAAADGWLSSGLADLAEADRCREEILALRRAAGRAEEPFAWHARLSAPDPQLAGQAVARGWHDLVVWADQVWPRGVPLEAKVAELSAHAAALGVPSPAQDRELEVVGG
jgi:probable F420-dependent oxidoreductase